MKDDFFCALFAISIAHYYHYPNQDQLVISGCETMTCTGFDPVSDVKVKYVLSDVFIFFFIYTDYLLKNYVTFDSKFIPDTCAGIPSEKKRQNHFTVTLMYSSTHLIQPFSYLTRK